MALKFYAIVAKGLKLKVRKFCGLITTFVEVTEDKTGRGSFLRPVLSIPPPSRIGLLLDAKFARIPKSPAKPFLIHYKWVL